MKKVLFAAACLCATLGFAQARELVRPGDAGLKREVPPKKLVPASPDRPQEPIAVYSTPFAVNFCSLSIPSAPQLDVYGMRLNITVPFATPDNLNVLGFDLGLSGEAFGHVGGVAINVFDNVSDSFSGGAVSGVCSNAPIRKFSGSRFFNVYGNGVFPFEIARNPSVTGASFPLAKLPVRLKFLRKLK